MSIFEYNEELHIKQEREIAMEEGRQGEKREMARKMLASQEPLDKITQYTGLSLKEINSLSL